LWAADRADRLWPGAFPDAAREARDGLRFSRAVRDNNGFSPRPDMQGRSLAQLKAAGVLGPPFHFLDRYRLGGHLSYLHRLLDWARARGVEVVLVDMPVSADLERLYPGEFALYRAALAAVEQARGVTVLRATRADVGLGDADFADQIHLN